MSEILLRLIDKTKQAKASHLRLAGLAVSSLPENFIDLKKQITSIEIVEKTTISEEALIMILTNFTSLVNLKIEGIYITEPIIVVLANSLKSLIVLRLADTDIKDSSMEILAPKLKKLRHLDLTNNHISEKGAKIISQNFKQLVHLNLFGNSIGNEGAKAIAEGLPHLVFLDLFANGILGEGVVAIGEKLRKLTHLCLWENHIGDIGAVTIAENLFLLSKLDLWGVGITDTAGMLVANNLSELTSLEIGGNSITTKTFIAIANNLKKLTFLNLSHSSLEDDALIKICQNLGKLTDLMIVGNLITERGLYEVYLTFRKKKNFSFSFSNNKATTIPESAQKSWQTLKEYFDSIERKEDRIKVSALNILLLGNTTAGKSSLLDYYVRNTYSDRKKSTFGIVLESFHKKFGRTKIEISVWDFGGQEYFHGTHRLFLGIRNSIYVILWQSEYEQQDRMQNEKKDDCFPFRYWLGTVQHFNKTLNTERSIYNRTLLVQSKEDINETPYPVADEFTEINGRFSLPAKNLFSISVKGSYKNNLRYQLLWQLFKLRFEEVMLENKATYTINKFIVAIKLEALPKWRSTGQFYLSTSDFIDRCSKIYTEAENSENFLLDYLESCGEILRFEVSGLNDKVFLNPKGLLEKIYSVLNNNVQQKEGRFTEKDILDISYSEKQILLEIMIEMELVFENPQKPGEYIAPQYMKDDSTSALLHHLRTLLPPLFSLRFPDFMPRAYITQFISRHGGESVDGVFWKFGVLYRYEEGPNKIRILVEADPESRYLRVYTEENNLKYSAAKEVFNFFCYYGQNGQSEKIVSTTQDKKVNRLLDFKVINYLELSSDGRNFAPIKEILSAIDNKTSQIKSTTGDYMPIDSVFHVLLNKKAIVPKRIFFSYAHSDKKYKDEFEKHFASLKREGIIEAWNDSMIPLGGDWDALIKQNLNRADVVLYMLSPSFMQSDYIWQNEIKKLVDSKGEGIFIPIFISPCDFEYAIIGQKQGAPLKDDDLTIDWIALYDNPAKRDEMYLQVTKKIRGIINQ